MDSRWVKGHSDKEARKNQVKSFRTAFDELSELLDKEKKRPVRDYGPGWQQRQIAVNEWNAAVETLQKLIDLKE